MIGVPLDYLLSPDAVVHCNLAWNSCEENLIFVSTCDYKPSMMMQKPFTAYWSNMLEHLELTEIICLAIPGQRMETSVILV